MIKVGKEDLAVIGSKALLGINTVKRQWCKHTKASKPWFRAAEPQVELIISPCVCAGPEKQLHVTGTVAQEVTQELYVKYLHMLTVMFPR